MSKRTHGLARRKNDAYDTPEVPVLRLLPHLLPGTRFIEPCAGRGDLIVHLEAAGHVCTYASDIDVVRQREDLRIFVEGADAMKTDFRDAAASCFITNPPWTRKLLHPIIANLFAQLPTWMLFDADWAHNKTQAPPFLEHCDRIVSAGRVKWIPDSAHSGVDNAAWYRFDKSHRGGPRFYLT